MRARALLLGVAVAALSRAALADARLEPRQLAVGESATLRVQVDGGRAPAVQASDGLDVRPVGQSTEVRSVNGTTHAETSLLYQVTPTRAGHFTLTVGGETLALDVSGTGAPRTSTAPPDAAQHLAFLRVSLPKSKLWVGEAVPVTFKAYFRAGTEAMLNGAPSLGASTFTVGKLSEQPRQSIETIGGTPYRVATWTGVASAATSGAVTIAPSLPVTLRYREQAARPRDPFAGFFGDDDPFGASPLVRSLMQGGGFGDMDPFAPVRERDVTLRAAAEPVTVMALPTAGRPASFSGAVGQFDVAASTDATGSVDDPLTLRTTVTGRGNFDRVSAPVLADDAAWKSYPATAKPDEHDAKRFEQPIVPLHAGTVALPAVELSYFDPVRGQYVTKRATPATVQVAAAAKPTGAASVTAATAPERTALPDEAPRVAPRTQLHRQAWPWLVQGALLLLVGLGLAVRALRHRSAPRRAESAQIAGARDAMHRARDAGDALAFFDAARRTLKLALAARWHVTPDDVTEALVTEKLGDDGAQVRAALHATERARFGGRAPDRRVLAEWTTVVDEALDRLEA